jgi:starvation-inducible DNA-binding protein
MITLATIHKTRHDLPLDTRERMIALLNQQLADAIDLQGQTKQAHWNVKGREFFPLHELFDRLASAVNGYVDLIAERATALGGEAEGTVRIAARHSHLPEYPVGATSGMDHVEALAERYAAYAATTRAAIDIAADNGDQVTADLFTEIGRGMDQLLWFLEAHLQA